MPPNGPAWVLEEIKREINNSPAWDMTAWDSKVKLLYLLAELEKRIQSRQDIEIDRAGLYSTVEKYKARVIREAVKRSVNKTEAAKLLKVGRTYLARMITKFNIRE